MARDARLFLIGLLNASALTLLRTPLPPSRHSLRPPKRWTWTLGASATTTTTGLALAGSCLGGVCALPVATGFWGLPVLNALVAWNAALGPWVIRGMTGLTVLLALWHWRRVQRAWCLS